MDIKIYMQDLGIKARTAAKEISRAESGIKNRALLKIADILEQNQATLISENQKDLTAGQQNGLDSASLDRLTINAKAVQAMVEGLKQVAALPDPVGEISDLSYRPSGIQVGQMRVPLGVIGIIYESRPNVTIDAAALCLKSGNACILRGGSEAIHSNQAIAACITEGLVAAGLPIETVQIVTTADRAAVGELITLKDYVDVIVPRGGKSLIAPIKSILKPALTILSRSLGCLAISMRACARKRFFILRAIIRSQISSDLFMSVKKLSSLNSMVLARIPPISLTTDSTLRGA